MKKQAGVKGQDVVSVVLSARMSFSAAGRRRGGGVLQTQQTYCHNPVCVFEASQASAARSKVSHSMCVSEETEDTILSERTFNRSQKSLHVFLVVHNEKTTRRLPRSKIGNLNRFSNNSCSSIQTIQRIRKRVKAVKPIIALMFCSLKRMSIRDGEARADLEVAIPRFERLLDFHDDLNVVRSNGPRMGYRRHFKSWADIKWKRNISAMVSEAQVAFQRKREDQFGSITRRRYPGCLGTGFGE